MKRLLGIVLLAAAVLAALIWFYTTVDEQSGERIDSLRAIPSDAALVFESKNAADLWRDLSQSSVIWEELQATDLYFRLNAIGHGLDSAMRKRPDLRKYLDRRPIAFSVHPAGAKTYSFLLVLPLSTQGHHEDVTAELAELFRPKAPATTRTYEGVTMHTAQPAFSDSPLTFFITDGILGISLSAILADEAVRALKNDAHILTDAAFKRVRQTADANSRGQLYINHTRLAAVVKPYVNEEGAKAAFFQSNYATWSALDLTLKSNAFLLNGFTHASDSTSSWLANFTGLKAPGIKVLSYMPPNTAYFCFYGFGEFAHYHLKVKAMREARNEKFRYDTAVKKVNSTCNCDAEKLATGWLGSQAAAFITEPTSIDYAAHRFAIFHTRDRALADESLEKMEAAFKTEGDNRPQGEVFDGYVIYKLGIGKLYGNLLGEVFSRIDHPYAVRIDDMVIMGNAINGVRMVIQAHEAGKNLLKEEGFKEMANQLSSEAHFVVYSAMARSPYLYEGLLGEKHAAALGGRREVIRKFQGMVYQTKHLKANLFYNNIYFKHNPIYSQETTALWEAQLKAPVIGKPHLVKNHYTNALDVLVQDQTNRIYLISNTGKVLWEVQLEGKIQGDIEQVDVLKNRKLQMLIGTPEKIYLLDRNGNSLDGWPISLPAKSSAPPTVVDYDNSRDYRIFAPLSDGRVLAWDARGKAVEGWSFADKASPVIMPITHIRVRSKDYLFGATAKGKIHLLDRRGNPRHEVETPLPAKALMPIHVDIPDQVITSGGVLALDSAGVMHRIGFDGRMDRLDLGIKTPRSAAFADFDGDGTPDCLVQLKGGAIAYTREGKKLFEIAQDDLAAPFYISRRGDGTIHVAAIGDGGAKLYVYNAKGELLPGFPLIGNVIPVMGDMQADGNLNLVTGMMEGNIYGYGVQK